MWQSQRSGHGRVPCKLPFSLQGRQGTKTPTGPGDLWQERVPSTEVAPATKLGCADRMEGRRAGEHGPGAACQARTPLPAAGGW